MFDFGVFNFPRAPSPLATVQTDTLYPFHTLNPKRSVYGFVLSYVWLFVTPWTVAHQAPLVMEFSKQEYWSRLPFSTPGDLPNQRIEPVSLCLLNWQTDSLLPHHLGRLPKRSIGYLFCFVFSLWSGKKINSWLIVQHKSYGLEHLSGNPQLFVHLPLLVCVSP